MDSFRRGIDQAFEQKLRERFEDFRAPDKAGLFEKILESIETKPRRRLWLAALGVVLLLMLALPAGLMHKKLRISGHKKVLAKSEKIKDYSSKSWKQISKKYSTKSVYKQNASVNVDVFLPETESSETATLVADSSMDVAPVRANFNEELLLSAHDLHFRRLALPGIKFEDSNHSNEPKLSTKSLFIPVFSVTGLQQYQLVNLHSDSEMPFQNVQFARLLDARSKGYKVSVGLEKGNLRLLLNYGNLRNWSYYELGTSHIEIRQTSDGQYVQRRGGIPHVIDEELHLLGLTARTALPLRHTPLRRFSTLAGLEFTAVLPDHSIMFWANISSVKSFHFGKKTSVAIGPFAEYSISQRSFLGGRWQSRPYRIGLTTEIKFTGK